MKKTSKMHASITKLKDKWFTAIGPALNSYENSQGGGDFFFFCKVHFKLAALLPGCETGK